MQQSRTPFSTDGAPASLSLREQPISETEPRDVELLAHANKALAKNALLNLAGLVAPLVAGVIAIPILNRALGTERVGFLMLTWAIVGYFGAFDLGLGRALTMLVSERIGSNRPNDIPRLVWTAFLLLSGLSTLGGACLVTVSEWLVTRVLVVPGPLQSEALHAMWLISASIPLVITSAALRGVLEAEHRFFASNLIRVPLGIWMFLGPCVVLPFSKSLVPIVALLLVGRFFSWCALLYASLTSRRVSWQNLRFDGLSLSPLFRFGGWMTASNVVSPIMVYVDRFVLGTILSLQAVAFYATPFEVVTKALIIPAALVGVLFPLFSALATQPNFLTERLYHRCTFYLSATLLPATLGLALFAKEGLRIWLGEEFAQQSYRVTQILALGITINGLANLPFTLIQARRRPDLTAKLHLVELPPYLLLLVCLSAKLGIIGVAISWTVRAFADWAALSVLASRVLGGSANRDWRSILVILVVLCTFGLALLSMSLRLRFVVFASLVVFDIILFVAHRHMSTTSRQAQCT